MKNIATLLKILNPRSFFIFFFFASLLITHQGSWALLLGDLNFDNQVTRDYDQVIGNDDYSILRSSFTPCPPNGVINKYADYNYDGCVGFPDLSFWNSYYQSYQSGNPVYAPDAVQTIPEPETIILLGLGLLALAGVAIRRNRKRLEMMRR